jgi:hypothetical protein
MGMTITARVIKKAFLFIISPNQMGHLFVHAPGLSVLSKQMKSVIIPGFSK